MMTSTTEDIDLETLCNKAGLKFEWDKSETPWMGMEVDFSGDRVVVKSVILDGPAYKAGLNSGDEIIAINGMRMLKDRFNDYAKFLIINESYLITVARLSMILNISINIGMVPAKLKAIVALDKKLAESVFNPVI